MKSIWTLKVSSEFHGIIGEPEPATQQNSCNSCLRRTHNPHHLSVYVSYKVRSIRHWTMQNNTIHKMHRKQSKSEQVRPVLRYSRTAIWSENTTPCWTHKIVWKNTLKRKLQQTTKSCHSRAEIKQNYLELNMEFPSQIQSANLQWWWSKWSHPAKRTVA